MAWQEVSGSSKLDLLLSESDKITSFDTLYQTALELRREHRVLEYIVERLAQSRIRRNIITLYEIPGS